MGDKFTIEIIKNALDSLVNEMFWITVKTAKSPILYEVYDLSASVTDRNGDLVALSLGIPIWTAIPTVVAKQLVIGREDIFPGDILISNDPYLTGSHVTDLGLIKPVFFKNQMIAVSMVKGHVPDIGGMATGSLTPEAREIYQEGLIIPPLKYHVRGKPNKDVIDFIRANVRTGDTYMLGDLAALAAGTELGDRRVVELASRYGIDLVKAAMNDVIEDGFNRVRAKLKELPHGTFRAEDYLDDAYPASTEPLRVSVEVTITDEEFVVDLGENPKALHSPINCTYPTTLTAASIVIMALVDPHMPFNQGVIRPLKVIAPTGSMFNVQKPYPTNLYWETASYLTDLIWRALAPVVTDTLPAGHPVSTTSVSIAGNDPHTNEFFVFSTVHGGGWGGHAHGDGENVLVNIPNGETYMAGVEMLELKIPILVQKYQLNVDDGCGHGKYRGGFGVVREMKVLVDDLILRVITSRSKFPTWGVLGGTNGTTNSTEVIRNGEVIKTLGKIADFVLKKGDIIRVRSAGGGGWGNPLERRPASVLEDVKERLIALEQARDIYGVAIRPELHEVDWELTSKLRAGC